MAERDAGDAYEDRLLRRAASIGQAFARSGLLRSGDGPDAARERARGLREALESLGPTFAKLGQLLSTRPDLLSPELVEELSRLQDDVAPLPEGEAIAAVERELGAPWQDSFASLERAPLAAGTIAQVHRAVLPDGTHVVVKVQRPAAEEQITQDLALLERFVQTAANRPAFRDLIDLERVSEHLSQSLRRELDFRIEAASLERMQALLAGYDRLAVPRPYPGLSTARLLVMEEVGGAPAAQAPPGEARRAAARQLVASFYEQVLGAGFFHADPHPGNLRWHDERLWFLDLGMVGELDAATRDQLLLLVLAFSREDAAFLAEICLMLSGDAERTDVDLAGLEADLAALLKGFRGVSLGDLDLGALLQGVTRIAARHRVRLPASLALAGKALAQMQATARQLDPELDPLSLVSGFVLRGLARQARERLDPQRALYDAHRLRLRLVRLVESLERLSGARPGPGLAVRLQDGAALQQALAQALRTLTLSIVAGACVISATIAGTAGKTLAAVLLGALAALAALGVLAGLSGGSAGRRPQRPDR
jgi:predicted unusual protein kinase regulating ubiquinone biosynthesis (AarF/ABC1/UbiB family)